MASIKLISILSALLLVILPISFSASAVSVSDDSSNIVYSLPFPSPDSFGECSQSVVMYNEVKNRFTMFVLRYELGMAFSSPSVVNFRVILNCENNDNKQTFNYVTFRVSPSINKITQTPSESTDIVNVAACELYQYNWTAGSSSYTVVKRSLDGNFSPNLAYNPAIPKEYPLVYTYGSVNLPYEWSTKYTKAYNGTYVNNVVGSNVSYSFSSSEAGATLSILNDLNGTVSFYLSEILNRLDSDGGYTPEHTTTNADMSDYANAEGALMDDNIQALNDMSLPDLNSFNSGKQGNAFQFISSNIEFFSGMNGSGSIAKVGSVLLVVLGLGLTSFIIGLSNRRKG